MKKIIVFLFLIGSCLTVFSYDISVDDQGNHGHSHVAVSNSELQVYYDFPNNVVAAVDILQNYEEDHTIEFVSIYLESDHSNYSLSWNYGSFSEPDYMDYITLSCGAYPGYNYIKMIYHVDYDDNSYEHVEVMRTP